MEKIEIMSPAGTFESLNAAIKAGADSVYFGVDELNMRARSANFTLKDLPEIVKICKKNNIKTYLTVNTVIYDSDFPLMKKILDEAKNSGITAIIASDIAVMQYCKKLNLRVHSSTQLNISNIEAVKFYAQFVDVVVLARELTLSQIENICKEIKKQNILGPSGDLIQVELFCHGALCVSISGKCYMSLAVYNSSANRGACLQNCRRTYRVIDEETGDELKIDNKHVMSPKDLCTIKFLDQLIKAGVTIFKIEGRARPPEYVYTVAKVYKEAVNTINNNQFTEEKINSWLKQLETVYNRGFWHGGYYLGAKLGEWAGIYGSKATKEKEFVGTVKNYFVKNKVAEIYINTGKIKVNDTLLITGPTTGLLEMNLKNIVKDNKTIKQAKKLDTITIEVPERVRIKDKVYLWRDRK